MGADNVMGAIQETCAVVLRSHSLTMAELVSMVSTGAGVPAETVEAALRHNEKFSVDREGKVMLAQHHERKRKSPPPASPELSISKKKVCENEGRVHDPSDGCATTVSSNHDMLQQSTCQAGYRHLSLAPPQLSAQAASLNEFTKIAIQSVVLCETSNVSSWRKEGGSLVLDRIVGIQCRHCVEHDDMSTASLLFPKSLRLISRSITSLLNGHLKHSCPHVPIAITLRLESAMKQKRSGDDLQAYLELIIDHYEVMERDREICREHRSAIGEKGAAEVSKVRNSPDPEFPRNYDADISAVQHSTVSVTACGDPEAPSKEKPIMCDVAEQESGLSRLVEFDHFVAVSIDIVRDQKKSVGAQCRHCRTSFNLDLAGSTGFTSDRHGMPAKLCKMAKYHLINSCKGIPLPVQSIVEEERKRLRRHHSSQKHLHRYIQSALVLDKETAIEDQQHTPIGLDRKQHVREKKEICKHQNRVYGETSLPRTREFADTAMALEATPVTPVADDQKEAKQQLLDTEATNWESHSTRPLLEQREKSISSSAKFKSGYVHYSLAPKSLACLTSSLSESMQIAVQGAVFCEVVDVAAFAHHTGATQKGMIGIQCRYCVQHCCATACPISFPKNPGVLIHAILTLAQNHLGVSCQHITWPVQQHLKEALRARKETHTIDGFLSFYLEAITEFYQMVGVDGDNGIVRMRGNWTEDTETGNTKVSSPLPSTDTDEVIDLSEPPDHLEYAAVDAQRSPRYDDERDNDDDDYATHKLYSLTPEQLSTARESLSPYDQLIVQSVALIVKRGAIGIQCRYCSGPDSIKFPGNRPSLLRFSMYIVANKHLLPSCKASCKVIPASDRMKLQTCSRVHTQQKPRSRFHRQQKQQRTRSRFLNLTEYIRQILQLYSIAIRDVDRLHHEQRRFPPNNSPNARNSSSDSDVM